MMDAGQGEGAMLNAMQDKGLRNTALLHPAWQMTG
jgi:hypothetical protein